MNKSFNNKSVISATNKIIQQGKEKGLEIRKNSFTKGYSITMPYGTTHSVETDIELSKFVAGY
jgi:hypothetical protein